MDKKSENYAKWQFFSFFLDTSTLSLDYMINDGNSYPKYMTPKKWRNILREMKEGFEIAKKRNDHDKITKAEMKKVNKSFDLFKEHFFDLWD